MERKSALRKVERDIPGGPVIKNLPCNIGDAHSTPGQGTEIPCAAEQLGPSAEAREAHTPQRGHGAAETLK